MKRQRKGLRSTQERSREILKRRLDEIEMVTDFHPAMETETHNQLFTYVGKVDPKGRYFLRGPHGQLPRPVAGWHGYRFHPL